MVDRDLSHGHRSARALKLPIAKKVAPKNKKPTQLASGSNLSALLLWLQIRPSPGFKWVPKAKPVGIGAVVHEGSVLRSGDSRKLFLGAAAIQGAGGFVLGIRGSSARCR